MQRAPGRNFPHFFRLTNPRAHLPLRFQPMRTCMCLFSEKQRNALEHVTFVGFEQIPQKRQHVRRVNESDRKRDLSVVSLQMWSQCHHNQSGEKGDMWKLTSTKANITWMWTKRTHIKSTQEIWTRDLPHCAPARFHSANRFLVFMYTICSSIRSFD